VVEEMIGVAARSYVRYAVDPANDIEISGERVYFCTSGEAVSVLDYATQTYRPTRLVDLYDAARLVDRLDNIHCYGQPFIAAEYSEDVHVHDINVAYAALAGTNKPFAFSCATVSHVDDLVAMFDLNRR
jgi:trimethylamine--corrinoid protein Co-methyltransferase